MNKVVFVSIITAALLWACKGKEETKPKETTKPTVTLMGSVPEAHEHDGVYEMKVRTGETFRLDIKFEDNEELSQANVEIHDAADGHTHRFTESKLKWFIDSNYTLSGKLVNWSKSYTIPSNAWAVMYHMLVKALDKAGNESNMLEIDLKVISREAPLVTVLSSILDGKIINGQSVTISGTLYDASDLAGGKVTIHFEGPGERGYAHKDIEIPSDLVGATYSFMSEILVPANAPKGKYYFHIEVEDNKGHLDDEKIEVLL